MKKPKKSVREQIAKEIGDYNALATLTLAALEVANRTEAAQNYVKSSCGFPSKHVFESIIQESWMPPENKDVGTHLLPKDRIPAERVTQEAADAHSIPEICIGIHDLPGEVGSPLFMRLWNSGEIAALVAVCPGAKHDLERSIEQAREDAKRASKRHGLTWIVTEYGWLVPPREYAPFEKDIRPGAIDYNRREMVRYALWGYDPSEPMPDWLELNPKQPQYSKRTADARVPDPYGWDYHRADDHLFAVEEADGLFLFTESVPAKVEIGGVYSSEMLAHGDKYQLVGEARIRIRNTYKPERDLDDKQIVYLGPSKNVKKPRVDDEYEDDESDDNPLAADSDDEETVSPAQPLGLFDAIAS